MKYMIWNNKGGVGKTFITYLLASEYAKTHTDTDVIVIDLCPQANVSEMLLGGNGKGEDNLTKCYDNGVTIAGYIKSRYDKSRFGKLGSELGYFVNVSDHNKDMPKNLYLLPGDTDLDICSAIINYLAQAPEKNSWAKSRTFLIDLIDSIENDRASKKRKLVFFFDCNPSFANYTEMAVIAADRIIVPCTADSASIRGIHNLFRMIYGVEVRNSNNRLTEDSVFDTFVTKAKEAGLILPKIHLFIQNKSRVLDKEATVAFRAHMSEVESIVANAKSDSPDLFSSNDDLILNIKDGNTLASIANHTGLPLFSIQPTNYRIYGKNTKANQTQITALQQDVEKCVKSL